MGAGAVIGGAPTWVYVLLAVLIALGIRRLRTREVPLVVALLPSAAFLIWSLIAARAFAVAAGSEVAAITWVVGVGVGAASAYLLAEPRGMLLPNGRVRQPGTPVPLVLYLTVFVVRFACGAWGAIRPEQALLAATIGVGVGAAMTGRLVAGVFRWRRGDVGAYA